MVSAEAGGQNDLEGGDELAPGTELLHGQYTIVSFLNAGGFGITYRAVDSLDRKVVIKECFPGAFCRRSRAIVQPRSRAHTAEFDGIVRLFVEEARSLSKLQHPNIVGVHQVFEENDTAYMALDFVEGRDLLDILEDPEADLPPERIVSILDDMLDAVRFVHAQDMLHRDISPDNILMDPTGKPVLIDFGAARQQAQKQSRVLSAMRVVKDGYSPQEFYITGSEQGPFSDLYALGASFHHLIAGDVPPDSQRRLTAIATGDPDPYEPLAGRFPAYDDAVLASIDKALSILPKDRMQSAAEWMAAMKGGPVPASSSGIRRKTRPAPAANAPDAPKRGKGVLVAGVAAVAIAAGLGFVLSQGVGTAPQEDVAAAAKEAALDTAPERIDETSFAVSPAPSVDATTPTAPEAPVLEAVVPAVPAPSAARPLGPEAAPVIPVVDATPPDAIGPDPVAGGTAPEAGIAPGPAFGPFPAVLTPETSRRPEQRPPEAALALRADPEPTPRIGLSDPVVAPIPAAPFGAVPGDAAASAAVPQDPEVADTGWGRLTPFLAEIPGLEILPDVSVASGRWTLALPYDDLRVDAQGRSWVVTVDGEPVPDRAAFDAKLAARHDLSEVGTVDVVMGIGPRGQAPSLVQTTTLAAVHDTTFPGGPTFRAEREDGAWVTRVIALPGNGASDLQVGDVVLGSMDTGLPFSDPDSLIAKIDEGVALGSENLSFAVMRDGSTWVASLTLPTTN